jgi:hypothetical protein
MKRGLRGVKGRVRPTLVGVRDFSGDNPNHEIHNDISVTAMNKARV